MAQPLPAYVAQRRPAWEELGRLLDGLDRRTLASAQLLELDHLYRRAAADLAHVQSFYSGTDANRFLNQLCARAYGRIYRRSPDRLTAMREFFARTFPLAVREELAFIGVAAGLLALGALVGATTLLFEPGLAELLVPEHLLRYVADHRLWTDEMKMPPSQTATHILTNNLQVTVGAFALGITGGLGTAFLLLNNGLSIGAIVAHCFNGGLGSGILVFMSAHGFVELSVIAICGGAGLMVGHALVVPTERPRGEVLSERAARAVQLVVGCAPFLAAIGVVEGYVSPGDVVAAPLKVTLGAALGLAFWAWLLHRRSPV